ncbi:MAG: hypothetical protein QNM02_04715 [Acidimicrobiia bacterium]|nr:hypothetical protein [Acidimicrobiia bacterium]
MSEAVSTSTEASAVADFESGKVTVSPGDFRLVKFDGQQICDVVAEMAELVGIPNPIRIVVDETTPLARLLSELDGTSSDAQITIRAESGALEDTRRPTVFDHDRTATSIGRMLLRARDRMRPDFADVEPDIELSVEALAAWDAYSAGRLAQLGRPINQQRWLYNYRNRFGFSDDTDAAFERLWVADDIGWPDVMNP